jgi:hypothetical protein
MTDKEFVLSVYPGAKARKYAVHRGMHERWTIDDIKAKGREGICRLEAAAWASAAKRIREQQAKENGNG